MRACRLRLTVTSERAGAVSENDGMDVLEQGNKVVEGHEVTRGDDSPGDCVMGETELGRKEDLKCLDDEPVRKG